MKSALQEKIKSLEAIIVAKDEDLKKKEQTYSNYTFIADHHYSISNQQMNIMHYNIIFQKNAWRKPKV